jgi:hypothetical protein
MIFHDIEHILKRKPIDFWALKVTGKTSFSQPEATKTLLAFPSFPVRHFRVNLRKYSLGS